MVYRELSLDKMRGMNEKINFIMELFNDIKLDLLNGFPKNSGVPNEVLNTERSLTNLRGDLLIEIRDKDRQIHEDVGRAFGIK